LISLCSKKTVPLDFELARHQTLNFSGSRRNVTTAVSLRFGKVPEAEAA